MSNRRIAALALLGVLVLGLAFLGYKAVKVVPPLLSLRGHLATLEMLASSGRADGVSEAEVHTGVQALRGVHKDLECLYGEFVLVLPLLRGLGWVPAVGGDLAALPDLAELGLRLTDAASTLAEAAEPYVAGLLQTQAGGEGRELLPRFLIILPTLQPALAQAQSEVDAAAIAGARIDRRSLSPGLARQIERLDRYLPLLQLGLTVAQKPELLGANGPRTYLLIAQNSDELRATGGFISGVGVLTLDQGHITSLKFYDSYQVDDLRQCYPDPPPALYTTMLAELWLFRDGNWSPDWPTSARTLERLYEIGQKQPVDGVIALDLYAVQMLVEAVGPLQVAGFTEPVTGKNVLRLIRQAWEPDPGQATGEWWRQRKDFMGTVAQAMLDRALDDPGSLNLRQAAMALERALREKHLLVYLHDPQMARFLADHGWDGAMSRAGGDFLVVVDSNVGFNKVNPLIEEQIAYHVRLGDEGRPRGQVTLSYTSRSTGGAPCLQEGRYLPTYAEMMHRCYWDYVRVYVPADSVLIQATPAPLPEGSLLARQKGGTPGQDTVRAIPAEADKTGWSAFFVLPPQGSRDLAFTYELPGTVLRREGDRVYYDLWVQKQAGTDAWPVIVRVELPPGAQLLAADPEPASVQGHIVTFEFRLSENRHVGLSYRQ